MIANFKSQSGSPALAMTVFAVLVAATLTDAQSEPGAAPATDPQGPPRIVSTSPAVGATDVDPGVSEISVTFDRDMGGGCSWTGGGPVYPTIDQGKKIEWRDRRTCVLPVKLESGRYYRVGINSKSHQNFRSAKGVPARPSVIYFTTEGASDTVKQQVLKPKVVDLIPKNGATDVDPGLSEIRVTFNVAMGGGRSWTGGGPTFPTIPEGKKIYWTEDHKTCVMPVRLEPGKSYRIGLNSRSHINFQTANGVPLDPILYTFSTKAD